MHGATTVFATFDLMNPQHLVWLKRKLARAARYERQFARRNGAKGSKEARHKQSRKPSSQLKSPLGRDNEALRRQRELRESFALLPAGLPFWRPMPHPQYRRDAITGRIL